MDRQFCVRSDYFLIFVLVAIGIIIWVLIHLSDHYSRQMATLFQEREETWGTASPLNNGGEAPINPPSGGKGSEGGLRPPWGDSAPQGNVYQLQRERDFQRARDPMIPPIQRGMYPPTVEPMLPFNIPTQGGYGPFQQVGYVSSSHDSNEMFRLMGRQLDTSRYEYYVIHPYTEIKIPIKVKNDWELHTDDHVEIPGFHRHYHVQIYDYDRPRYIPY
jgi:hypothetical protein